MTDDPGSRVLDGRTALEWTIDLIDAFSPEKRALAVAALAKGDAGTARIVLGACGMAHGEAVFDSIRAALAGIGAPAVGPLVDKLEDEFADEAFLISALTAMPTWAVRPLWDCATDRGGSLLSRIRALRALSAMRPLPDRVNDLLSFVMRDETEEEHVREAAVACIASWDPAYVAADGDASAVLKSRAEREGRLDAELAAESAAIEAVRARTSEQPPEDEALITAAIAREEALRVRCMQCGEPVVAFGSPKAPGEAAPRFIEMAALYCRRCDLVVCSRCAKTVGTGWIGGGECPRCFQGMEPADVTELPGTGIRVIGPL